MKLEKLHTCENLYWKLYILDFSIDAQRFK